MITVMGEATSVVCDLRPQKEVAHGTSERGWYERSYHSLPRSDLILWMCKNAAKFLKEQTLQKRMMLQAVTHQAGCALSKIMQKATICKVVQLF